MESKKINQLATELAPELSDLTIIGDPTTGISKKITLSQMASLFTGTVEEYASLSAFPLVGTADTIYIALDTNILYRWNTGTSAYVELSPNVVSSLVFNDANGFDGTISLVGSVATLTITTALTQGSVPFIGASGALTQDNANLFFDDTNNRLGINTNTPTTALDVFGSGIIGRVNGTSTNNAFLGFASAGSNKWSIGNVQSDHRFRIYNEATTSELVSVLQTGEFGIGIANPTTKLHIDGGASALIANLDADISIAKSISFRSDNSARINIEVSGTESGSNVGADLFIRRYSDAGALLGTPVTIARATGYVSFSNNISIGTNPASDASGAVIRLPNNNAIRWRNGANSADFGIYLGTDNLFYTDSGINISGRIAGITNQTTPTDGNAYFYKSITGAVISGYQFIAETGDAGSRATRLTINQLGAATFTSTIEGTIINSTSNAFRFSGNNALSLITLNSQSVVKINAAGFWGTQIVGANDKGILINSTGEVQITSRNLSVTNNVSNEIGVWVKGIGTHSSGYASIQSFASDVTYDTRLVLQENGGNVYVGTTTNLIAANRKLQVTGACAFSAKSTGSGGETVLEAWQSHTAGDNSFATFYTETSYTYRGGIDYNRGSNVVRYNTTSDANLKNIIGDSDKQKSIDILNSTKIREYSWKNDENNKPQIGVIAQELYETYKGAVSKGSEDELFGTEDYKTWSVDKTAFTFHLIAGWQKHEEIIANLEARIKQLESK